MRTRLRPRKRARCPGARPPGVLVRDPWDAGRAPQHLGIALELEPDHPAIHGLLGQVAENGQWRMPQAVVEDYLSNPETKATVASAMPAATRVPTRAAHWQLAEWCEENGLKAEAKAHFAAVVRLNPAGRSLEEAGISQAERPMDNAPTCRCRA